MVATPQRYIPKNLVAWAFFTTIRRPAPADSGLGRQRAGGSHWAGIGRTGEADVSGDDAMGTWSAGELAAAIRRREIGSRELLDLYLDRVDRLDKPVGSVVTLDVDRARQAAAEADEATARGESSGVLHGLPITVKDAIETAGLRSTGGAIELTDHVPAQDAPAVARLKDAGAIVFGKTNLPRWSGDLQTYNEIFGTTNNPWDRERVPGGSSGGAAAAVASGFTSFELGTDIAGSVRIPAHFCGVFGLKPSYGLVPQRGYLDHVGGGTTDADINVFGPIARSAPDLDLLLGVLAGPEPERALAWRVDLPGPRGRELADYRIGVWLDDPACPVESGYAAVLADAVQRLTDAGARIEDAHPPVAFEEQRGTFFGLIGPAVSPSAPDDAAAAIAGGHRDWLRHDKARAKLRAVWAGWFEHFDLLLCPVTATPAIRHQQEGELTTRTLEIDGVERPHIELISWTGLIGVVGLPAAVPPIGRTADGLPVGIQVVAPYLRDRDAIHVAGLVADVLGGYQPPPGF
jgi:amidase